MKKVLIAEDDPGIRDALQIIFQRAGYAVTVLANGQPILEGAVALPDIFILDVLLSGVDGLDVCRFLKQGTATAHIPIIVISASPHAGKLAKEACADDFMEKPFRNKELLAIVAKIIGRMP